MKNTHIFHAFICSRIPPTLKYSNLSRANMHVLFSSSIPDFITDCELYLGYTAELTCQENEMKQIKKQLCLRNHNHSLYAIFLRMSHGIVTSKLQFFCKQISEIG